MEDHILGFDSRIYIIRSGASHGIWTALLCCMTSCGYRDETRSYRVLGTRRGERWWAGMRRGMLTGLSDGGIPVIFAFRESRYILYRKDIHTELRRVDL
jgi:hypothetical protein